MKKRLLKKLFSCVCSCAMVFSLSVAAFAADTALQPGGESNAKRAMSQDVPAIEGNIGLPERVGDVEVVKEEGTESQDTITNALTYEDAERPNSGMRETWRLVQEIYNGTGSLSADDSEDFYIVQTTEAKSAALKIVSDNPNVVVQLCMLDLSTGNISRTNFYDGADGSGANVLTNLPAGDYALSIYSANPNEPAGDYTLMWNCANPKGASTIVHISDDIRNITLGYKDTVEIYCNGYEWLKDIQWTEHYTFAWSNGYSGRDQDIDDVKVKKVHKGRYDSKKYQTNNALFVEAGEGSLWSFTQSYFQNDEGDVTHIIDWNDATGQKTPRRFDSTDVTAPLGPHYLVIDIDTAKVVDFASNYNYLRLSGETDGKVVIYNENILGQ